MPALAKARLGGSAAAALEHRDLVAVGGEFVRAADADDPAPTTAMRIAVRTRRGFDRRALRRARCRRSSPCSRPSIRPASHPARGTAASAQPSSWFTTEGLRSSSAFVAWNSSRRSRPAARSAARRWARSASSASTPRSRRVSASIQAARARHRSSTRPRSPTPRRMRDHDARVVKSASRSASRRRCQAHDSMPANPPTALQAGQRRNSGG